MYMHIYTLYTMQPCDQACPVACLEARAHSACVLDPTRHPNMQWYDNVSIIIFSYNTMV